MTKRSDGSQRRSNVYDVAALAGVSIATVSRVLSDTGPVAAATKERVLAAADDLRWRPNRLARDFVAQSHGAVGIVVPELAGPYYSRIIAGFEQAASARRQAVLVLATHERPEAAELVADLADRVDGVAAMSHTVADDVLTSIRSRGTPVVGFARRPVEGVPSVRTANTTSATQLVRHVVGHGWRNLAFVGELELSNDVDERWVAMRACARKAGLELAMAPSGGLDVEHGYKAGLHLFGERCGDSRIDAALCANDELAYGVMRAAAACGLSVPADAAVTGWDDNSLAARVHPSITTVHQPMASLGGAAATMLFDLIDAMPVASATFDTELVVRESCGCSLAAGAVEEFFDDDRRWASGFEPEFDDRPTPKPKRARRTSAGVTQRGKP